MTERSKEMIKKSNDSSQERMIKFANFCSLVVVIGTLKLWGVYGLSKISSAGTNNEQSIDSHFLPYPSIPTSSDGNSTTGASHLQGNV
jgi:hypothetical protein